MQWARVSGACLVQTSTAPHVRTKVFTSRGQKIDGGRRSSDEMPQALDLPHDIGGAGAAHGDSGYQCYLKSWWYERDLAAGTVEGPPVAPLDG